MTNNLKYFIIAVVVAIAGFYFFRNYRIVKKVQADKKPDE